MRSQFAKRSLLLVLIGTLTSGLAFGLSTEAAPNLEVELMKTLIFTLIALSSVALVLAGTILTLVRAKMFENIAAREGVTAEEVRERYWSKLKVFKWSYWNKTLNDAIPLEEEESIDMGHEYDGIRELDNNLPPWWKYGFYVSIAFAFVYLLHFHVAEQANLNWFFGESMDSKEEFAMAMEEAEIIHEAYLEKVANMVNESNVVMLTEASSISSGKQVYQKNNCQSCHGQVGEGGIGPNLTDIYWKHGGDIKDVFKAIKYGIPATAMKAWQKEIKPKEMQELTSFVMSLQGTAPANGKAPEGKQFVQSPADSVISESTVVDTTSLAIN
ncbi:MAG: cbb3-type cytochrome c oxidase N-terminal domain-containing protein [Bacteroidota bacterium]